jgi:hypothetical protein
MVTCDHYAACTRLRPLLDHVGALDAFSGVSLA